MKESKYIRADLLMNKIAESAFFSAAGKAKIRTAIEKEPGEDVKPVVHAHWVYGYTFPDGQYRKCSACNELIKVVANDGNFCGHCGAKMDEEDVDQIKRIEAEPVKHAHWVACEDEYEDEYKCSACGGIQFFAMTPQDEGWEYCPHCGAKMDKEEGK